MTEQFISSSQWDAIKSTVSALNAEEAQTGEPLPEPWRDLADHWQSLLVASTGDVRPFAVTEHFLALLQMFIDGGADQEKVAPGSQLVIDWAKGAIAAGASFGLKPNFFSDKKCWLIIGTASEKELEAKIEAAEDNND